LTLEISKLESKKEDVQQKIQNNQLIVQENLFIISPAIESEAHIDPNKLLTVAIVVAVGGITSLFIVFILHLGDHQYLLTLQLVDTIMKR
jgi:uncharacterized protein involved in exopolysaccharide biosynthesis